LTFNNGLTVAELKQIVADWPDTDPQGNPCEVWIEHYGLSNQVLGVSRLNFRKEGDAAWADLLLEA
jgi:hypothetical protein